MKTAVYSGIMTGTVENINVQRKGLFYQRPYGQELFGWMSEPILNPEKKVDADIMRIQSEAYKLSINDYNFIQGNYLFGVRNIPVPEGWVDFDTQALLKWKGELCPNLCLISNQPCHPKHMMLEGEKHQLGLQDVDCSNPRLITGKFWRSKKGTPCFRHQQKGKHMLVKLGWEQEKNSMKGMDIPVHHSGVIHYVRKAKTDESKGVVWMVVPSDWIFE